MNMTINKAMKPILKVIYTLLVSGLLIIWVMQNSINAYWTQTYHRQSPLASLSQYKIWRLGGEIHQSLLEKIDAPRWQVLDSELSIEVVSPEQTDAELIIDNTANNIEDTIVDTPPSSVSVKETDDTKKTSDVKEKIIVEVKGKSPSVPVEKEKIPTSNKPVRDTAVAMPIAKSDDQEALVNSDKTKVDKDKSAKDSVATAQQEKDNAVKEKTEKVQAEKDKTAKPKTIKLQIAQAVPQIATINKKQMVFFAGDSLMQGVAPHVKETLHKQYGIKSIDLSKQSTGLTYSSFFDWPKTIKNTLEKHKNIGLLVIFLGPNDPWNMPNPKGKKYLSFKSPDWESVYRDRIRQIIDLAKKHDVQIMWLGVPDMRKEKLTKGVRYLNTLYRSEVEKAEGIYMPTQFLLTGKTAGYSKYAINDEHKKVAVRTNDGIHFTITGQKRIARRILLKLRVKEE